jgi:hypothetical protein
MPCQNLAFKGQGAVRCDLPTCTWFSEAGHPFVEPVQLRQAAVLVYIPQNVESVACMPIWIVLSGASPLHTMRLSLGCYGEGLHRLKRRDLVAAVEVRGLIPFLLLVRNFWKSCSSSQIGK